GPEGGSKKPAPTAKQLQARAGGRAGVFCARLFRPLTRRKGMLAGAFSSVLWTLLGSLIVVAGALVYGTLIRQISARRATAAPESTEAAPRRTFGLPEALLA